MTISEEELKLRREILCSKLSIVRSMLSFFGVPSQYQDDLIQEIYIIAYRHVGKVEDMSKLNSWLYKVSYRKTLAFMGKQREINEKEILCSPEEWEKEKFNCTADVWNIIDGYFNDGEICGMVAKLKWPAPQIIKLRFVDGFTLKEIAQMMGLKYNTVKTIEYRAFKQLKCMVEAEGKRIYKSRHREG